MTQRRAAILSFERPDSEEARALIGQLDADLLRRYPDLKAVHGLHAHDLSDPSFSFVIAWVDGRAVGCGALRRLDPSVGEVKRMFVQPEFRGRGIARQILETLETRARDLRYASVWLETGIGQPEAIALYKSAGYREFAGFGEYIGNPFSICFEKRLISPATVPTKMVIRQATVNDAKHVADVMNSVIAEGKYTAFDRPFSEEEERDFISSLSTRSALHIAEIDGNIVGVQSIDLFSTFADSVSHVATMGTWLRSAFRGRGIGRCLAEESFSFARNQGYRKVVIQVLADNDQALSFYRSLGFRDIGLAKEHVRLANKFHDEIYLEKDLGIN
jgi:ribosomal protein S18 acetylase RimI-like enzyme